MIYKIELLDEAKNDIMDYIDSICYDYGLPKTASRIYAQLSYKINTLKKNPAQNTLRSGTWYLKYGLFVRRINFKSRAIIYTINEDVVYIHRIVSQNEITGM